MKNTTTTFEHLTPQSPSPYQTNTLYPDDLVYLVYDAKKHLGYRMVRVWDIHRIDPQYNPYRSIFTYKRGEIAGWDAPNKLAGGQPSLAGMPARVPYSAPVLPIDIDAPTLMHAAADAHHICVFLESVGAPYHLFYSGKKGFHIEIPDIAIGILPALNLAELAEDFVRRIIDATGVDSIDGGIYTRHHKYRVTNCPREGGTRKIWLPDRKFLRAYARLEEFSRHGGPREIPPYWGRGIKPSPVLVDMWEAATQYINGLPPVTVLSGARRGANKAFFDEGDIRVLVERLRAADGVSEAPDSKAAIRCPNPAHNDRTPSAVSWPNGWVFCSSCGENFSPSKVGSWIGVRVRQEEVKEEVKDDADVPTETLEEARARVSREIYDAVGKGESFVARVQVGVGKSTAIRSALRDLGKSALYMAPTHEMLAEAVDHLAGPHLRPYWELEPRYMDLPFPQEESLITPAVRRERGLCPAYNPDTGVYQPLSFFDEAEYRVQALGRSKMEVLVQAPFHPLNPDRDPTLEACRYMAVLQEIIDGGDDVPVTGIMGIPTGASQRVMHTAYAASAHIGLSSMAKMAAGRDLVIIDEDPIAWMAPTEAFAVADLTCLLSEDVCGGREVVVADYGGHRPPETIPLREYFDCLLATGKAPRDRVWVAGAGREGLLSREEWKDLDMDLDAGRITTGGRRPDLSEGPAFIGLNLPTVHEAATRFVALMAGGRVTRTQRYVDHAGRAYLIVSTMRDLSALKTLPVAVLDASADHLTCRALELALDRPLRVIESHAHNPGTKVLHDPERGWSRAAAARYMGEVAEGGEGASQEIAALTAYVKGLTGVVGCISQKNNAVISHLIKGGLLDPRYAGHYGALRGLNRLEGVDHLILLGDPAVADLAYAMEACRWAVDVSECITYGVGYEGHEYRLNYPRVRPVAGSAAGGFIYKRLIIDELYQAMGRARGLGHDVTIHALCAPDVKCSDYTYELVAGDMRAYGPKIDRVRLWDLLLRSFLPATKIARETGLGLDRVRALMGPDIDAARLAFMTRLLDDGMTQTEVARVMMTSRRNVSQKIQNFSTQS